MLLLAWFLVGYTSQKLNLFCVQINYPDFALCELLNQLTKFEPTCLKKYPILQAYLERFEVIG